MKRIVLLLFLLLSVTTGQTQERLYVVQYGDESLATIDLTTGFVNTHAADLGYGCNDIIAVGTRLYVTNSLINTVQEIDAVSNHTLRDLPMNGGLNPYSIAQLNSDTLAVTHFVSNNVLLVRLSDGEVVGGFSVGIAPEGILVNGDRIFVCCTGYTPRGYAEGKVFIFDRNTLQCLDSLHVGVNPQSAAVDDRNRLHVVCTGDYSGVSGEIHVFNLSNPGNAEIVAVGGTPSRVSFGGGYAFLAAGGWSGSGQVLRYRLNDLVIVNGSSNPISTSLGAYDVAARMDGSFYASCSMADVVEQYNTVGGLVRSFPVSSNPGCIAIYGTEISQNVPIINIKGFATVEAYPNPFNSVVWFRFKTPTLGQCDISIYNEIGQEIDKVAVSPGSTFISWRIGMAERISISSNIYFAKIDELNSESLLKLVLIK